MAAPTLYSPEPSVNAVLTLQALELFWMPLSMLLTSVEMLNQLWT